MNMPGFNAEFSFRKMSGRYQYAATRGYSSGDDVRLALMNDGGSGSICCCGDRGCTAPIYCPEPACHFQCECGPGFIVADCFCGPRKGGVTKFNEVFSHFRNLTI